MYKYFNVGNYRISFSKGSSAPIRSFGFHSWGGTSWHKSFSFGRYEIIISNLYTKGPGF